MILVKSKLEILFYTATQDIIPTLKSASVSKISTHTPEYAVVDRLLPFLHNMTSEGRAWQDNKIHKDQVLKMHQFIENERPEIYEWLISKVEYAVEQEWLDDS